MTTPANPNSRTSSEHSDQGPPAGSGTPERHGELAQAVADTVVDHPAVVRLDSGPFGVVASYLPGRRLVGVSLGADAASAEIAVVLSLGYPLPPIVEELRSRVRRVLGDVDVDIAVSDVVIDDTEASVTSPRVDPVARSTERRVQ
jgi:hypothetical protein